MEVGRSQNRESQSVAFEILGSSNLLSRTDIQKFLANEVRNAMTPTATVNQIGIGKLAIRSLGNLRKNATPDAIQALVDALDSATLRPSSMVALEWVGNGVTKGPAHNDPRIINRILSILQSGDEPLRKTALVTLANVSSANLDVAKIVVGIAASNQESIAMRTIAIKQMSGGYLSDGSMYESLNFEGKALVWDTIASCMQDENIEIKRRSTQEAIELVVFNRVDRPDLVELAPKNMADPILLKEMDGYLGEFAARFPGAMDRYFSLPKEYQSKRPSFFAMTCAMMADFFLGR
jgi:hypothetical protein